MYVSILFSKNLIDLEKKIINEEIITFGLIQTLS